MATFNDESLDKLFKKDLNPIIFLKSKPDEAKNSNTELLDEISNLKTYFQRDLLTSKDNTRKMPSTQGGKV